MRACWILSTATNSNEKPGLEIKPGGIIDMTMDEAMKITGRNRVNAEWLVQYHARVEQATQAILDEMGGNSETPPQDKAMAQELAELAAHVANSLHSFGHVTSLPHAGSWFLTKDSEEEAERKYENESERARAIIAAKNDLVALKENPLFRMFYEINQTNVRLESPALSNELMEQALEVFFQSVEQYAEDRKATAKKHLECVKDTEEKRKSYHVGNRHGRVKPSTNFDKAVGYRMIDLGFSKKSACRIIVRLREIFDFEKSTEDNVARNLKKYSDRKEELDKKLADSFITRE